MSATGRVVLVTGGSRGIGLACAHMFLRNGDRVAVTYRTHKPELEHEAAGLPNAQSRFLPILCDVGSTAEIDAAFKQVEAEWGPVEVLVANAGITKDQLLLRMSEESFTSVLDTNLVGSFRVVKRAVPAMLRARKGRVILISSVGAYWGTPGQANYAASKAGLIGMARSLARELASRQITVNVVAPGPVDTEMTAALSEEQRQSMIDATPLGRMARPEEVAAAVSFLASHEAAFITGAIVPVDGGLAMGH